MDPFGTSHQKTVPLSAVKTGKSYAIVITTNAGLWRYLIADTVRFTSLDPYRIRITGRTKHHINAIGEELMIENTDKAWAKTAKELNADVVDYTVSPACMNSRQK